MSGTPEGLENILVRPYTVALLCAETSVALIYVPSSVRPELPRVLPQRGQVSGIGQEFVFKKKCADGAIRWPGHPALRGPPGVGSLFYQGHVALGLKSLAVHELHRVWRW